MAQPHDRGKVDAVHVAKDELRQYRSTYRASSTAFASQPVARSPGAGAGDALHEWPGIGPVLVAWGRKLRFLADATSALAHRVGCLGRYKGSQRLGH